MEQAQFQALTQELQAKKQANGGTPLKYDAATKTAGSATMAPPAPSPTVNIDGGGQSDNSTLHPEIIKSFSDFIGTTNLGKGMMQAYFLNIDPEGKQLMERYQSGEISHEVMDQVLGGVVTPNEVIGSSMQTLASLLTGGIAGKGAKAAMQFGGAAALSGAGSDIQSGKETSASGRATQVGMSMLAPKMIEGVGSAVGFLTHKLPEKLFSQFFKTTAIDLEKEISSGAANVLKQNDPAAFQNLVEKGIIKVGADGNPIADKSLATKALESGLGTKSTGRTLNSMAEYTMAKGYSLENKVQQAAASAPDVKLSKQYIKSFSNLLQTFRDSVAKAEGGKFANPLLEPLDNALKVLSESKGTIKATDALQIRRMLDGMQSMKAFVPDANLSVSASILKNATNYMRGLVNALPGMGDLMGQYSDNIQMLKSLVKEGAKMENKSVLNLFDMITVMEGSQIAGGGRAGFGKGLMLDALIRFLKSSGGSMMMGRGLNAAAKIGDTIPGEIVKSGIKGGARMSALGFINSIGNTQ